MTSPKIVLAGATGDLGGRIARALRQRGAEVTALVRRGTPPGRTEPLETLGVTIAEVDLANVAEVAQACAGAACVVSALSGLRDVIVDRQTVLLDAAVRAGVPRFIPSDYSADFTKLAPGTNRNFDLRRAFRERLLKTPIASTTILNGAFADMLTGDAPFILFKFHRVLYWGSADQRMDFTTKDDVAAFVAEAALDPTTPPILRIAGEQITPRELAALLSAMGPKPFRLFRAGGVGRLETLIAVTRRLVPGEAAVFPPWQGMQYWHNMATGDAKLDGLDNARYPNLRWTGLRAVLADRIRAS